jgi:hypothetical protein
MSRELTVCPNLPDHEYSAEFLLSEMKTYRVDHVVISHVCYYGRDNSYPSDCVKKYPGRFAAIGLLVGHRLYAPGDRENPSRDQSDLAGLGELLCGGALKPVLFDGQRLGGKEGSATLDACPKAQRVRLEEVE